MQKQVNNLLVISTVEIGDINKQDTPPPLIDGFELISVVIRTFFDKMETTFDSVSLKSIEKYSKSKAFV